MTLSLEAVSVTVGPHTQIFPSTFELPGGVNVLLGATLAGKTTLLRLMAGLEHPSSGRIREGERDVTRVNVRQRQLAMVYQQFVNYPSLTVYENIASPLRVARLPETEISERVRTVAGQLRLSPLLDRRPQELSGGQQQRCALARALVKRAPLVLLDEPLVNLDYKLREELRIELKQLFADQASTVVYATTDPLEALQLQGTTVALHEGRVLQQGPALEVFHSPASLTAARVFSDPPLNVVRATADRNLKVFRLPGDWTITMTERQLAALHAYEGADVWLAIRAHQLAASRRSANDSVFSGGIDLAEISGSATFIHVSRDTTHWVAQLSGVHTPAIGEHFSLYFEPEQLFAFEIDSERRLFGPPLPG